MIFVVLSTSAANDNGNGGNDSMGSFRLARALQRKVYKKSLWFKALLIKGFEIV